MARRARTTQGLSGLSNEVLEAELRRRRSGLSKLERKYQRAAAKAANLARAIERLGGMVNGQGGRGPGRPKKVPALGPLMLEVLQGKELSIDQIMDAVQQKGYVTRSTNFRSMVSQALGKSTKFKRVSRGIYTAK